MAAQCYKLTDVLVSNSDQLWMVPQRLIDQARQMNKSGINKRQVARKTKSAANAIDCHHINSNHIHKLII